MKILGRKLVYNFEPPGHRKQLVYINDNDGRQFVYYGRQLVCYLQCGKNVHYQLNNIIV